MHPAEALEFAHLVLGVHLIIIGFNLAGLIVVPLGVWLRWNWVRACLWRAAHLLSHPYLVIGRAQRNRIRVEDPLKLLPPPGEYDAHINGKPTRLTVDAAQELITRDILPEGRVVITF